MTLEDDDRRRDMWTKRSRVLDLGEVYESFARASGGEGVFVFGATSEKVSTAASGIRRSNGVCFGKTTMRSTLTNIRRGRDCRRFEHKLSSY